MKAVVGLVAATVVALTLCAAAFAQGMAPQSPAQKGDVGVQVVGGKPVTNGKYPFVAALYYKPSSENPKHSQFCTASLLDNNTILTAAHCVVGTHVKNIGITIGRTVLSDKDQGILRVGRTKAIHPNYGDPCPDCNDVAVINFKEPVKGITPIHWGQDNLETPGRKVLVAGWGSTDPESHNYPDRMHEATLPMLDDQVGEDAYDKLYEPPLMVVAGTEQKDTCYGDSGGPIFDKVGRSYKQIGITSFGGDKCAMGNEAPGVYTEENAESVRDFLEHYIN